jgi:uncharacterized protein YxjI
MNKIFITIIITLMVSISSAQLPNSFNIEEYAISMGTDFKIPNVAYIDQEIISLTSSFNLTIDGKIYARSKERLVSFGSIIDITDSNGKKIGSIEEHLFYSIFGMYSLYNIYDSRGSLIGTSTKHELMSTSFTIRDKNGQLICTITRPAVNFVSDVWTVNFTDTSFDKRLIVFIPCYKTHKDNQD